MTFTRETVVPVLQRDRGAVLVMVALVLPVLILFAMFAIEVGNWFVHKRHLQVQVDAAALAGGDMFGSCLSGSGGGDTSIYNEANKYNGATGSTYNGQIGGSNKGAVTVLYQKKNYADGTSDPDLTSDLDPPCTSFIFDVKATEAGLPVLFGDFLGEPIFGLSSWVSALDINAHARVKLVGETVRGGTLPVAVPDPGFPVTAGAVDFINEDTGAVLGSATLQNTTGITGAWNTSATPASVDMAGVSQLGVVVKLSGANPAPSTVTCGQLLTYCYDLSTVNSSGVPSKGIVFTRGYPSAGYNTPGSTGEPSVKSVTLLTGGSPLCADPYFFSILSGTCNLGVQADVTFPSGSGTKQTVSATITGANGYTETNDLSNTSGTTWKTTGSGSVKWFSVPAQEGPLQVTLSWTKNGGTYNGATCGNGSSLCKGNWTVSGNPFVFQRSLSAADPYSGPITAAVLHEGTGASAPVAQYSYPNNGGSTTHSFWINIQLQPAFGNATSASSPPVYLRVLGSQNQSIDCDPNYPNLRTELAQGCRPQYEQQAPPFSCPSYSALWSTNQPWKCVKTQTGGDVGQVTQGLEDRMARLTNPSTTCPPNNWSLYPSIPAGDPRLVPVILTLFGSFGGSGNDVVPVTGFSEFYITGWAKQGGGGKTQADCTGDDAPPAKGYIVGRFLKYVDLINTGGGTVICPASAFGNCVPVLTR